MNRLQSDRGAYGFTLIELLVVMAILSILIVSGLSSFTSSQKKSRDVRRKNDLRQISLALESYYNDFGNYPVSDITGGIKGCGNGGTSLCAWGSTWKNTASTPETIYMLTLPADFPAGYSYYYSTDATGTYFKLYARLENLEDEGAGTNQSPGYTGTVCGSAAVCTYGIASTNTSP